MTVRATPETVSLASGTTTVALDPGAGAALQSLGIAAAPIGSDALAFPITGGTVNAKTFAGRSRTAAASRSAVGPRRVELTDFTIGIDDTPDLTALVGGQRVPILTVDLSALKAGVRAGRSRSRARP